MDEYNIYEGAFSGPQIDNILANSTRQDAIAIVSNNNTHIAITAGQYVYVKSHGTLAEGMYNANYNIAANGTLTSSNLTAVSNGVANELKAAIDNLFQADSTYPNSLYRMVGNEKEWLNPPMATDTEYRTVERARGSLVVYTKYKRIPFSASDGTVISPVFVELYTETSAVNIVEVTGNVFRARYGIYTASMPARHSLYGIGNKVCIACMSDYPANSYADVTIKYHK